MKDVVEFIEDPDPPDQDDEIDHTLWLKDKSMSPLEVLTWIDDFRDSEKGFEITKGELDE